MNLISVLFGPKNSTFGNLLTQKYWIYLLVCAYVEWPPWAIDLLGWIQANVKGGATCSEGAKDGMNELHT